MQISRTAIRQLTTRPYARRSPTPVTQRNLTSATPRRFLSLFIQPNISSPRRLSPPTQIRYRFGSSDASSTGESFPDPSRPDLFYHIVQPPTPVSKTLPAYALSFMQEKPPFSSSATIIGWLPAQGRGARGTDKNADPKIANEEDATLEDFVGNPRFIDVLHSTIREGLKEGVDEIQKATAMQTMEGWMHIHDQRNIPALNRIGNPDDIIGTVLVESSEILSDTYQPMPAYRLVTSDGLMQLTPGLAKKLQGTLATIAKVERAASQS